ncbi:PAS domain S-box protein [Saccharicrinis sp. FJH54]|uniref:PAS domain S-box protein n=1 Tax=Saccharicrinis sp. FJH54 TaxID=3344665 RepID=UPI0035D44556
MNETKYSPNITNAPFGYALHKIIVDDKNKPVDYSFIEVNRKFEELTGLKAGKIIGKSIKDILPGIVNDSFDWISFYGDIAINLTSKEFEQYSDILNRWYKVNAFSPEINYFVTYFTDITDDKRRLDNKNIILGLSNSLLSSGNNNVDYEEITKNLLKLSGAKYGIFSLYSEDQVTITHKAVCGLSDQINKVYKLFGFSLHNKEWTLSDDKLKSIREGESLKLVTLDQLTEGQIPPIVSRTAYKMLGLGKIYTVQIRHKNRVMGDFLLFYSQPSDLENTEEVKTYVNIVGIALNKYKAEIKIQSELTKNKELRYLNLNVINAIQDGISVLTPDFTIISANNKIKEWNGSNAVEGKKCYEVYRSFEKPCKACACKSALETGKVSITEIHGLYGKTDNIYEISALPIIEPETGKITSIVELVRDITETRKAETELQNQKDRLYHLITSSNSGTWEWNVQTGETIFNERWANIIGYTLDELEPVSIRTWEQFMHPDDARICETNLNRHFEGEVDFYNAELRIKHKSGSWIWILDQGQVISRTEDGKPEWMFGTHQDITERKLAELKIKESEEKYKALNRLFRTISDNMTDMLWAKDLDNKFIFTNKAMCDGLLNAKDVHEPIDKTDIYFANRERKSRPDNPEWHTFGEICMDSDAVVRKTMKPGRFDEFGNVKGKFLRLDVTKSPLLDDDGKIIGVVGSGRDVTVESEIRGQLKKSEERYRNVVNGIKEVVFETDAEGLWTFLNPAWTEMTNFTVEESVGTDFLDYVFPDDRERNAKLFKPLINKEKPYCRHEIRYITKDGGYKWVEVYAGLITDENGNTTGTTGTLMDITERKIWEKELLKAKEKAEESDRLKSAFLANMSHEIRTPMNAIVGFASFLLDKDLSRDEISRYSEYIISSGDHLLELINDIIDISKIDAGQIRTTVAAVNITELLKEVEGIFSSHMKFKQKEGPVELIAKIPSKAYTAETDIVRLRQILINLINNALKFTHKGHVEFGMVIKGPDIEFYVKDTGIGIAEKDQQIIFERFRQASDSTEKIYGGTGLGLSIAKAYVELLGGKITLFSEPGNGSTFRFTIPNNSVETVIAGQAAQSDGFSAFNGEHILVAEDDYISYKYLYEVLSSYDLKVSRAENGEQALKSVLNDPTINLVLMDILMPVMDGLEATRKIREKKITVPVIAQTAFAFESDRERCINAGCDDYLSKPVKEKELVNVLHKYLNLKNKPVLN